MISLGRQLTSESRTANRIVDLFQSRLNDLSLEELIPSVTNNLMYARNAKARLNLEIHFSCNQHLESMCVEKVKLIQDSRNKLYRQFAEWSCMEMWRLLTWLVKWYADKRAWYLYTYMYTEKKRKNWKKYDTPCAKADQAPNADLGTATQILPTRNNLFFHWYSRRNNDISVESLRMIMQMHLLRRVFAER